MMSISPVRWEIQTKTDPLIAKETECLFTLFLVSNNIRIQKTELLNIKNILKKKII